MRDKRTRAWVRKILGIVGLALLPWLVQAQAYGPHDLKRLLTVTETPAGKRYGLDMPYLDHILNDLGRHARDFPPRFDTSQDRQRATQDARALSGMLDALIGGPNPNSNPELLLRAGLVNSLAYNLDVPGAGEKTTGIFQRLLALSPEHPRGNYLYGVFLAGASQPALARPYLEKAGTLGVVDAAYALGLVQLTLGNRAQALESLEQYRQHRPTDPNVGRLIEAIRNGKVEVKRSVP